MQSPTPVYSPPPTTAHLGALVGEFPGSPRRYLDFLVGAVVIVFALANANGVFGSIVTLDGTSQTLTATTVLIVLVGLACFGDFYIRLRGLHAWLYQQGFAIRRGDTTTAYRVEDIAAIQTWVKTESFLYIIPINRSRYTALVMKSGEKIELPPWYYSDANRLSQSIWQMWSQLPAQRRQVPGAQPAGSPAAAQLASAEGPPPAAPLYAPPSGSPAAVPSLAVPPPVPQPATAAYSQPYSPPPAMPTPTAAPPPVPPPTPTAPPLFAAPSAAAPAFGPPMMAPASMPLVPNGQTLFTPGAVACVDIIVGGGPPANAGQQVTIHYIGWLANGFKFDSSWERGQPFQFALGRGQVIRGWDEGIVGMHVGGRRRLTIPPALGFGAAGAGIIPPNATVTYDVDLLDAR